MKGNKFRICIVSIILNLFFISCEGEGKITFQHHKEQQKVDVFIDGKFFTSYIHHDTLKKQVLYPILSPGGNIVTRGFPINPRPNERVDHPHHIGHWFNYGNVNDLDFWNNSYAVPAEKQNHYGHIVHREIVKTKSNQRNGSLHVRSDWVNADGKILLEESTAFIFSGNDSNRIIKRVTTLTAVSGDVHFKDNKEGMFAIRMARPFEFPTTKPLMLTDEEGKQREEAIIHNEDVHGSYKGSNGLTDENVWGTRASWVTLSSEINNEKIAVTIMDHPSNIGHPTYWHARTYGLFAANPLGQKVFSNGKKTLNFTLKKNEQVTFRFQILISSGNNSIVESEYQGFIK